MRLAPLLLFARAVAVGSGLWQPRPPALVSRADDGLTNLVEWDGYSFSIRASASAPARRVFIQSGEFHPWRLPVPDLWKDVVQKAKAAGLNTISFYTHWGMINPTEGVLDLSGINDIQPFLDAAKEAGLFVIARPGPYINSETSAGGIPGWVTTIQGNPSWNPYNGEIRSNVTYYHNAWVPYIKAISQVIARNQITEGGPIILVQVENEYYNGAGQNEYVEQLHDYMRAHGIVVPMTINDSGMYKNLVDETDIYGIDAYPLGASSCPGTGAWRDLPTIWRAFHQSVNQQVPFMFPEFQGGAVDRPGGTGYDLCRNNTLNAAFERVFYHQLWASGVTSESFYMVYGGTTWGQLAHPGGYTSYDYAAAIKETRELTPKYNELKLQSLFLRSVQDIYKTDLVYNDTTALTDNTLLSTTWIRNPDTGAGFFFVRQTNVSSTDVRTFKLTVDGMTLPQLAGTLALNGRDSRVVTTNLRFGNGSTLLYSTAHILTYMCMDDTDVLVVYGDAGSTVELAFATGSSAAVSGGLHMQTALSTGNATLNFVISAGIQSIMLTSHGRTPIRVIVADYVSATTMWQPSVSGTGALAAYVDVAATTPVLVAGPYLVRTAALAHGTLALTGDTNATTPLTVLGPASVAAVTWNGNHVATRRSALGALVGSIAGPAEQVQLPDLMRLAWRAADSLPEITSGYNDAKWTAADHTTSTSVFPRFYGGPWWLNAADYGYYVGNILWRGHFTGTSQTAVNLSISGGANFAASAWLNGVFLGSTGTGNITDTLATYNLSLAFPAGAVHAGKENVVTVLQDHMGFNLAGMLVCCTPGGRQRDIQSPRGIEGYYLLGEGNNTGVDQFDHWKMQGNLGGPDFPDRTRKLYNEGGLFGERQGWHLPGFNDRSWRLHAPWDGAMKPGVMWYRATFELDIPVELDVPLSVVFDTQPGWFRAQLYLNGWQLGKRVGNLGPQTAFPVHEGILDYCGQNTVALSIWSLGGATADLKIPSLKLLATSVLEGGVGKVRTNNPGWKRRNAY